MAATHGIELGNSDPHCELEWTVLKKSTLRRNVTPYQEHGSLAPGESTQVNGPLGEPFMILVRSEDRILQRLRFDKCGKLRAWRLEPEMANPCSCSDSESQRRPEDCSSDDCTCAICLGDLKNTKYNQQALPCGHAFHEGCVAQWLRLRADCPLCRCKVPDFEPMMPHRSTSRSLGSINAQQNLPSVQPQRMQQHRRQEIVTTAGGTSWDTGWPSPTSRRSFSGPRGRRNASQVVPYFSIT